MYYRCRRCKYEEFRGCLLGVGCGVYYSALMGLAGAFLLVLIENLADRRFWEILADLGWWNLLVLPPFLVFFVIWMFVGCVVLKFALELIEYLLFALRKCPRCGARRWSWGYIRGFGL